MSVALREIETGAPSAATSSDVAVMLPATFRLQSGETLARPEMRLRIFGRADAPAIIVSGGISAGRDVADSGGQKGWWRSVVRPEGYIDLERFRVIGFDFLPNRNETARTISSSDQADALACALRAIGVRGAHAFVGASYGGMTALAFAARHQDCVERICVISAADRPHPAATALRGVQRRIVEFARAHGEAAQGVSLARQLAMITYRTPEEFAARFAHAPGAAAGDPYAVCDYLIARGAAYEMPAERFVTLSDSIDRHAVDLAHIRAKALFIAAASDRLVPLDDIRRCAEAIRGARCFEFSSIYGHDAFLKEESAFGPAIKSFIEE